MGARPGDLRLVRTMVNSFLPDTATITRNGSTVITDTPCRASDGHGHVRIPETAFFRQLERWRLTFERGIDVRAGDIVTATLTDPVTLATTIEVYTALLVLDPKSYSVATEADACYMTMTSDGSLLPVVPNATVSFSNPLSPAGTAPLTKEVYLFPLDSDERLIGDAAGSTHAVMFDPNLPIDKMWKIRTATLGAKPDASARSATLKYVKRQFGMLAVAVGYYVESV